MHRWLNKVNVYKEILRPSSGLTDRYAVSK